MATLNLGRIKPVFRGAYAGGTAYVIDDIVTSGNETFICIQASTGNATSNASYWTKLAAKGTDGTDVGTTITTQGDLLYRDGSGLQRLAKGTASQVLKMNAGATAPEWGADEGGGVIQCKSINCGTRVSTNTVTYTPTSAHDVSDMTLTMTPTAATSHFLVMVHLQMKHHGSYSGHAFVTYNHSGISETCIKSDGNRQITLRCDEGSSGSNMIGTSSGCYQIYPNTTNELTFKVRLATTNSSYTTMLNQDSDNTNNNDDGGNPVSSITVMEIASSISPNRTNTSTNFG